MKVKNVMTPHVECVLASDSLEQAATKMKSAGVGVLPVIDDGNPVGVVTDRDLVLRAFAPGDSPRDAQVGQVHSEQVTWCNDDDDVETAGDIMAREKLRRLLVRDGDGKLSGILSLGDLARQESSRDLAGRVLASVSSDG